MKVILHSLFSIKISEPLSEWSPPDPASFALEAMAFIGHAESTGPHAFDFLVCTPLWLAHNFEDPRIPELGKSPAVKTGCSLILMEKWDYAILHDAMTRFCDAWSGEDYLDIANAMSRTLSWEFDYRYDLDHGVDREPQE